MKRNPLIIFALLAIGFLFSCKKHNSGAGSASGVPVVITTAATAIIDNGATGGGNITSHGSSAIMSSGLMVDTSTSFLSPKVFPNQQGTDNFTVQMTNLNRASTYYYRAFAVNSVDTGFGNALQFTTSYTPSQYTVSTFAGSGLAGISSSGPTNGPVLQSTFSYLQGITVDPSGNFFICEFSNSSNGDIRKIASNGTVSTLASINTSPSDLVVDAAGNIYVAASTKFTILKVTPSGAVSTFAGSGGQASGDGTGTGASFFGPITLDIDTSGNLYVADTKSLRKITPAGVVTTLPSLSFTQYTCVAVDKSRNLYVSDGNAIKKLDTLGNITLLAGSATHGNSDGQGSAASFRLISELRVDKTGNIFAADFQGNTVRMITPAGQVTTLAGTGTSGAREGDAAQASFNGPVSLLPDAAGNIYVLDVYNYKIRKISHK